MKKRLLGIVFLCGFGIMCMALISAAKGKGVNPPKAYILMEAQTLTVLEESGARERMNGGYLSKLVGLLVVAQDIDGEKYSLDDELTASQSVSGTKGAVIWLRPGDKLTVAELLKGVIIGNANDAMTVLAENSCGTVEDFVRQMNTAAFDLGLRDSAFFSHCGFYDEREYTTAYDIAVICAELSKYDFLTPYFSTWRDFVKEGTVELVNENTLSRTYSRHIGFKASHSEKSGYCAAEGARNENGSTFIAVALGCEDTDSSLSEVKRLCNKGFSDYRLTSTFFPDEMLIPVKVKKGRGFAAQLRLEYQSQVVVTNGCGELRTVTVLPEYVSAPVKKGQKIGSAGFYSGKVLVYESDIVAAEDVEELSFSYILKKMLWKMVE